MKRIMIVVATLCISSALMAQANRNYSGASSQDTLKRVSTVTATAEANKVRFINQINFNTPVANDSVYLWESTVAGTARYLGKWIIGATAPAPFSIPINCSADSAYIIVKRFKTSDITIIYRY